jgi:hypothetical protein
MKPTVLLVALVIGCGGNDDSPSTLQQQDSAVTGETSATTDSGTPMDSVASDSTAMSDATSEAAPDVPLGPCNDLGDSSMGVLPVFMGGSAPTSSGGTITDGTYVLSQVVQYSGSASTIKDYGTVRFTAGVMDRTEGGRKSRATYTISTRFLKLTYTCGGFSATETIPFSASASSFTEYVSYGGGTRVRTFYKK